MLAESLGTQPKQGPRFDFVSRTLIALLICYPTRATHSASVSTGNQRDHLGLADLVNASPLEAGAAIGHIQARLIGPPEGGNVSRLSSDYSPHVSPGVTHQHHEPAMLDAPD